MNMIFNVYRDTDLGIEDQLLPETNSTAENRFFEPLTDPDCDSDEEVIAYDQHKCYEDFSWAINECEKIGDQLVTRVLLRNTDITDRCQKPELFDRLGKLRENDDLSF